MEQLGKSLAFHHQHKQLQQRAKRNATTGLSQFLITPYLTSSFSMSSPVMKTVSGSVSTLISALIQGQNQAMVRFGPSLDLRQKLSSHLSLLVQVRLIHKLTLCQRTVFGQVKTSAMQLKESKWRTAEYLAFLMRINASYGHLKVAGTLHLLILLIKIRTLLMSSA